MQLDSTSLFGRNAIIDPGALPVGLVRDLKVSGVATRRDVQYVRCANPNDFDYADAVNPSCPGRAVVRDQPEDDWSWCPLCGARIEISRKERFDGVVLEVDVDGVRRFLMQRLTAQGWSVREHPRGVSRVESGEVEVAVVVMDICTLTLRVPLIADQGAIAVAADCRRFAWELPPGTPLLSLASLGLDDTALIEAVRARLSGKPAAVVVPPPRAKPRPAPRFSLPPAADWKDVTIYYVDNATVGVCLPGGMPVHASAAELGMAKDKARGPAKRFALLIYLCMHGGKVDWRRAHESPSSPMTFDNYPAFKMQAAELRRDLQRLFGRDDDPFVFGERKPLVAGFRALPDAPGRVGFVKGMPAL